MRKQTAMEKHGTLKTEHIIEREATDIIYTA